MGGSLAWNMISRTSTGKDDFVYNKVGTRIILFISSRWEHSFAFIKVGTDIVLVISRLELAIAGG